MLRQVIHIDEEKCTGCGLCASACHEGAIDIVNGKAKLVRENFCDGMGDCLPNCPANAISFETREAAGYDEKAVQDYKRKKASLKVLTPLTQAVFEPESELLNWPVQIKLAPLSAPYYDQADLLIAADCTAYAYSGFHQKFLKGRTVMIGCPKLDGVDYSSKLADIFENNDIQSVTVVRMEVPCCKGLENAVNKALQMSGKEVPFRVVTISMDGKILD